MPYEPIKPPVGRSSMLFWKRTTYFLGLSNPSTSDKLSETLAKSRMGGPILVSSAEAAVIRGLSKKLLGVLVSICAKNAIVFLREFIPSEKSDFGFLDRLASTACTFSTPTKDVYKLFEKS